MISGDGSTLPNSTILGDQWAIRGLQLELVQSYKDNNAEAGLRVINALIAQGELKPKLILDTAKILVLAHSTDGPGENSGELAHLVTLLRDKCSRELGPLVNIAATVDLLLDGCEDRWDRMGQLLAKAMFKTDCFHLLAGLALCRRRLDIIEELCRLLPELPFSIAPKHPFWLRFLESITPCSPNRDQLMNLYMCQLIAMRRPLDLAEMDHLKNAVKAHGQWNCLPANVDHKLMTCSVCQAKLTPEPLDLAEFDILKTVFGQGILKAAIRMQSAPKSGVMALIRKIEQLKQRIDANKYPSRPLVVDLLNLVNGFPTLDQLDFVQRIIGALQREQGFAPVLLVTKGNWPVEYQSKMREMGVHVLLIRGAHRNHVHDDLFFLNAVLQLGPNAYLLTNDKFRDFNGVWQLDKKEAFDRWIRSRNIRFFRMGGSYLMPNIWHSQGDPSLGYHILVEEQFKQSVYCIRPIS